MTSKYQGIITYVIILGLLYLYIFHICIYVIKNYYTLVILIKIKIDFYCQYSLHNKHIYNSCHQNTWILTINNHLYKISIHTYIFNLRNITYFQKNIGKYTCNRGTLLLSNNILNHCSRTKMCFKYIDEKHLSGLISWESAFHSGHDPTVLGWSLVSASLPCRESASLSSPPFCFCSPSLSYALSNK